MLLSFNRYKEPITRSLHLLFLPCGSNLSRIFLSLETAFVKLCYNKDWDHTFTLCFVVSNCRNKIHRGNLISNSSKIEWYEKGQVGCTLGLVHTSDGSGGSGVVSGVGIGIKFWSSENRHVHDGSDGSGSGIGRKINSSDPSHSDSVELPTPLTIPFFDLHWIVTLVALPIPTPLPIASLVWSTPLKYRWALRVIGSSRYVLTVSNQRNDCVMFFDRTKFNSRRAFETRKRLTKNRNGRAFRRRSNTYCYFILRKMDFRVT